MKVPVKRLGSRQIANPISATPTFAEFMVALGAGAAEVYAASGRIADSVLMAPDRWFYMHGLTDQDDHEPIQGLGESNLSVHIIEELRQGQIVVAERHGLSVGDDWAYALITA